MDSRRKTYWPPARGYIAASSPYESAPKIVITPVTIHAISSQKGEFTVREMSAETMKMPEPIIEPATSIVASVSVSALTNSRDDVAVSAPVAVVAVKAPSGARFTPLCSSCFAGASYGSRADFAREPVSKNDFDFRRISLRRSAWMYSGTESHQPQDLRHSSVVIAVTCRIESNEFGVSPFVDIEERFHVKAFHRLWCRHWRNEQISYRW